MSSTVPSIVTQPTSFSVPPISNPIYCYNCRRNIALTLRITCCECVVNGKNVVVLCGDCFSVGVSFVVAEGSDNNANNTSNTSKVNSSNNNITTSETNNSNNQSNSTALNSSIEKELNDASALSTPPAATAVMRHVGSHRYKVNDSLDFQVFHIPKETGTISRDSNPHGNVWSAQEELLLLEGIMKNGVGNWKTISEFINQTTSVANSVSLGTKDSVSSTKTVKQVEDHYWEHYMGTFGYCLPSKSMIKGNTVDTSVVATEDKVRQGGLVRLANEFPVPENYTLGETVVRDKEKWVGLKSVAAPVSTSAPSDATASSTVVGYDLPGYMPLRQDFDYEFDNDAETLLANMEFNEDEDHPSEAVLKLQVVNIYNERLQERENRRAFVIQRGLVDVKKIQTSERRMSKEDRDILARLKVFARFHSPEEHEALIDSIVKARRLRDQISLYQHYRKLGIKTLEQARLYESERRKKDHEAKVKRNKDGGALTSSPFVFDITNSSLFDTILTNTQSSTTSSLSVNKGADQKRAPSNAVGSRRTRDSSDSMTGEDSSSINLSGAPGADLLTNREIALCEAVSIMPHVYLAMKDVIIREWYRNGCLTEEGLNRIVKLEATRTTKIFDFFVKELNLGGVENALCFSAQAQASARTTGNPPLTVSAGAPSVDNTASDTILSTSSPTEDSQNSSGTRRDSGSNKKKARSAW